MGKDSQAPAYFDDWVLVRPMTWWRAVALALMYPVDPTSNAVRCSLSDPFFTKSVCVPEVAPVSPCTVIVTPLCRAVELKCTPCVPTALIAAWYTDWALCRGVAAAPAAADVPAVRAASATTAEMAPAVAAVLIGNWRRGRMTFTLLEDPAWRRPSACSVR